MSRCYSVYMATVLFDTLAEQTMPAVAETILSSRNAVASVSNLGFETSLSRERVVYTVARPKFKGRRSAQSTKKRDKAILARSCGALSLIVLVQDIH